MEHQVDRPIQSPVHPELQQPDVFYTTTLGGVPFRISRRYEIVEIIGQGAYGVVAAAKDLKTGEMVAIKKMQHTFEHSTFTKRTLRELRILRNLQHENVVQIRDINTADGGREDFDEIYVVCDLMETDLGAIIKSEQPLCDEHFQFFLYQLLRGLKYCHSAGVVHRDLKPRNLLVNANCDLRICDFGLARVVFPDEPSYPREMTEYVATRWYRAPEILWAWPRYGAASDVWSAGCILAELLGRSPLFPGRNTQHQLKLILAVVGSPTPAQLQCIPNARCRDFILSLPGTRRASWSSLFKNANPLALDLLDKMIRLLPEERITVDEALAHPYLALLHHPEDEPTRTPLNAVDFAYEKLQPTVDVLRAELWRESHPEIFADSYLAHQTVYNLPEASRLIAARAVRSAIDAGLVYNSDAPPSAPATVPRNVFMRGIQGEILGVTALEREDAIANISKDIRSTPNSHPYVSMFSQKPFPIPNNTFVTHISRPSPQGAPVTLQQHPLPGSSPPAYPISESTSLQDHSAGGKFEGGGNSAGTSTSTMEQFRQY